MNIFEFCTALILGGTLYVFIELIWRGRSHISMFVAGSAAFTLLHMLFSRYTIALPFKCLFGALIISAIEFITGYIVNIRKQLGIWDYSGSHFNLYGQICLGYSLLWGLLTLPISLLSKLISNLF
ncbi:MAG: hypothetical protein RR232_00575 [Clostridia bacterium]